MKNQYEYTINSTEDIRKALGEADREGYALTHYNSAFYLRGEAGKSITVDDSLANLYVVAYGPAPVSGSPGRVRRPLSLRSRQSSTPRKAPSWTLTTPPPSTPTTTPMWSSRWRLRCT